jgi:hypothetical protein
VRTNHFKCERQRVATLLLIGASLCLLPSACSSSGSGSAPADGGGGGQNEGSSSPIGADSGADDGAAQASNDGAAGATDAGGPGTDARPGPDAAASATDGGLPAGWLYTQGNKILVSHGSAAGTPWMGRGVNVDDIFLCGYNNTLWMTSPDQTLQTIVTGLITDWKPTFVRISLGMASDPTVVSWLANPTQYKTPMTSVIDAMGTHAGVYVLVTLRSDSSMIGQDTVDGDPEATGLPSDSTTTPSATQYPTGTDATYVALVDSFAQSSFVLFGLTNEPGGNKLTNAKISAAMSHAVGVIRAEEDRLGVPHHLVSVQGNGWTSDISFYATAPIAHDNVVYEVHGYPPATSSYTYANIPVILGEYGSLPSGGSAAFYADLETKQIPNLAWDFEPYSNCAPDLVSVTTNASTLTPTAWGSTVKAYLLAH